jgi:mRNA-degrading endonuclease toxin of MazEF toxin-antitoxin module
MLPPAGPSPGDIYWGEDKGAVGAEQKKDRLWVIMSRRTLNGNATVVVVPLSSRVKKAAQYPGFCILLPAGEVLPDYGEGAAIDGVALCHQVRVFDKS